MRRKLPPNNAMRKYQRKSVAARRVGPEAKCACGEDRPEALIAGSKPTVCAECQRKKRGQKIRDDHHAASEANSSVTIPVPVNDHRAVLSPAQYDWPKRTLENPDGSPLLAGAGCIRGFVDTALYLMEKLLLWTADMLEALDALLSQKLGPKWWQETDLDKFTPRRKRNVDTST